MPQKPIQNHLLHEREGLLEKGAYLQFWLEKEVY